MPTGEFEQVYGAATVDVLVKPRILDRMPHADTGCEVDNAVYALLFEGAPATRLILKGIPTYVDGEGEMVTPTGASIVKYYVRKFDRPEMRVIKEGYGAGDFELKHPNVLKVTIGEKM